MTLSLFHSEMNYRRTGVKPTTLPQIYTVPAENDAEFQFVYSKIFYSPDKLVAENT